MASESETMRVQPGPRPVVKPVTYTCTGCPALRTEYWKDYLDNDETDSGTSASCSVLNKSITAYWHDNNAAPEWCPHAQSRAPSAEAKDGFVLVPKEPTTAMIAEGAASLRCDLDTARRPQERTASRGARNAWVTMVDAAIARQEASRG